MNVNEVFRVNEMDKAHQDILAVLDEIENVTVSEDDMGKIIENVAFNKDRLYYDYIRNQIIERGTIKMNKEIRKKQLNEAHQDVLTVLDNLPTIELTKEQINKTVEHIAGHKDKIYFDYIDSYIREIDVLNIDKTK